MGFMKTHLKSGLKCYSTRQFNNQLIVHFIGYLREKPTFKNI